MPKGSFWNNHTCHLSLNKPIKQERLYILFLLLFILLLFFLIEWKHPYFFLQDDNRDGSLPQFVEACRSILHGRLAIYNFYQFLGKPSFAACSNPALYPLMYLAGFSSYLIFGHYYCLFEILSLFHMLIAGSGMYILLRKMRCIRPASVVIAFSWATCSFLIYVSSSWWMFLAYGALLPWNMIFVLTSFHRPCFSSLFQLIAIKIVMFTVGFPELYVYTFIFELVFILVLWFLESWNTKRYLSWKNSILWIKKTSEKFILYYSIYLVSVIMLTLPMLLPIWFYISQSIDRSSKLPWYIFTNGGYRMDAWIWSKLFPYWWNSLMPTIWRQEKISHLGYIVVIAIGAGVWLMISSRFRTRNYHNRYIIATGLSAGLSLIWSIDTLTFASLIYNIPIINRFRLHFRLDIFTGFFLMLSAGVALSLSLRFISRRFALISKNWLLISLYLGCFLNFTLLYILLPPQSFEQHTDPLPLVEPLKAQMIDGRIISLGYTSIKGLKGHTAPTLGWNYAMLWGLVHFSGYDVLISSDNSQATLKTNGAKGLSRHQIPIEYLREWGVRYYIFSPKFSCNIPNEFKIITADDRRIIYRDPLARSLYFTEGDDQSVSVHGEILYNELFVRIASQQSVRLICNFIFNPHFVASVDGHRAVVGRDSKGRVRVSVPPGGHIVRIEYKEPWLWRGAMISLGYFGILTYGTLATRRKGKASKDACARSDMVGSKGLI